MARPMLLAVGGAHMDRRGQVAGRYVEGASNPGTMREEIGGGAFNALRAAVQRGVDGAMISLRGGDPAGEAVALAIETAGVRDLSATFLDRTTPSYTALIDSEGDVIAGLADMALYELAFAKHLTRRAIRDAIIGADAILVDANLPAVAIDRLVATGQGKPIHAIAISPAKVKRFATSLPSLGVLFMNRREAAALCDATPDMDARRLMAALAERRLKSGIVTQGDAVIAGFDADGMFSLQPPRLDGIADATGAGDALAGATIAALMHGLPLRGALREGVAAAGATMQDPGAVTRLPDERFREMLAAVPECAALD